MKYEPVMIKGGKRITRKQWEKENKPTCSVRPCSNWYEIHWHLPARLLARSKAVT